MILWRREWQPTPIFLPGESHGQRSLSCSPQGRTELDMTEQLTLSLSKEGTDTGYQWSPPSVIWKAGCEGSVISRKGHIWFQHLEWGHSLWRLIEEPAADLLERIAPVKVFCRKGTMWRVPSQQRRSGCLLGSGPGRRTLTSSREDSDSRWKTLSICKTSPPSRKNEIVLFPCHSPLIFPPAMDFCRNLYTRYTALLRIYPTNETPNSIPNLSYLFAFRKRALIGY